MTKTILVAYRSHYGSSRRYAGWLAERLHCPAVEWDRVRPEAVSYTHLDVYKRQILADGRPIIILSPAQAVPADEGVVVSPLEVALQVVKGVHHVDPAAQEVAHAREDAPLPVGAGHLFKHLAQKGAGRVGRPVDAVAALFLDAALGGHGFSHDGVDLPVLAGGLFSRPGQKGVGEGGRCV